MLEFFKFIFSNFWYFIGFLIILAVLIQGIIEIIKILKKPSSTIKDQNSITVEAIDVEEPNSKMKRLKKEE